MVSKEIITLSEEISAEAGCCEPQVVKPADPEALRKQVELLSALADPTRLGIVSMLAGLDEAVCICVCDIVSQFSLGQPTISHHLKVLRDANLVTTEKRGLWVYYSLNRPVLNKAAQYLGGLVMGKSSEVGTR
jgi:ArsR family transcriptional regulator, arsenate/arsenite/antimonite-responsive transcriptional repressor